MKLDPVTFNSLRNRSVFRLCVRFKPVYRQYGEVVDLRTEKPV